MPEYRSPKKRKLVKYSERVRKEERNAKIKIAVISITIFSLGIVTRGLIDIYILPLL